MSMMIVLQMPQIQSIPRIEDRAGAYAPSAEPTGVDMEDPDSLPSESLASDGGDNSSDGSDDSTTTLNPQLLEMLNYLAQAFLAMLQRQQSSSDDGSENGTGKIGSQGGHVRSLGGGGAPSPVDHGGQDTHAPAVNGGEPPATANLPEPADQAPSSGSNFSAKDHSIQQWAPDIQRAASATGLDPNIIGGQMWAESRGNANSSSKNIDGNTDESLMQISQNTWNKYVVPNLSSSDRTKIEEATGKKPEQLDMSNPHDNVVGGAFELKQHIADNGGNLQAGLRAYVGVGNEQAYADNVQYFANQLKTGQHLDDSR